MKLLLFLFFLSSSSWSQVKPENSQIVIVITEGWETTAARIYRFSRRDDGLWKGSPLDPVPAVVGRSGLAWGIGLHSEKDISFKAPMKNEGDGKAPAGIFNIGRAFGYDEIKFPLRLESLKLTPSIECVDDSESDYYNKIIDQINVPSPDWKTSEKMRRKDELYRFGIVIEHNPVPAAKGKGSCIFLHIWDGPETSTAGCTASHEHHIRSTMEWLDPEKKPLWIQLPWNEYLRLKKSWNLPEIEKKNWR